MASNPEPYQPPDADGAPELVITDAQEQRKRTTRRSIFVNGEFVMGVSEEIYVKYALFKGRVVTAQFIEDVRRAEEIYACREAAMRAHGARMRSRKEMRSRLLEKGFSEEAVQATMEFLVEYRMIDDDAFARAFVADQLLRRPVGRRRLGDELRRRGITKEGIAEALNDVAGEQSELDNALAAARKKAPTIRHADPRKWERSMSAFLAGRGFGWDAISAVLRRLRQERGATEDPFADTESNPDDLP